MDQPTLASAINVGQLWGDVSELARTALDTKRSLHDSLWRQISDIAGQHNESLDAATDRLIGETQELCGLEQRIKEEVRSQLAAMVSQCNCLVGNCQGLIDDHNAKLAKREANRQAQARRRMRNTAKAEGNLSATLPPTVPPPTPESVAGLYLRIGTEGDQLALDQFTPEMWSVDSPTGLFWSVAPAVFTRAVVAAYRGSETPVTPAASVYLNVTIPLPDADAAEIISGLGFQPTDYNLLSSEDAYYQAVDNWGQVTVDNLYDQRGITTYARRPSDVPRLRDIAPVIPSVGLLPAVSAAPPTPTGVVPAVEQFAADGLVPPGVIRPGTREGIILVVDKLIRLGIVRPEDRGRAELELTAPGEQYPGESAGPASVRSTGGEQPMAPPAGGSVVADGGRSEVLPVCPDWLRALLGLGGLDCSVSACDIMKVLGRLFAVPENKLPFCVPVAELLQTLPWDE